MEDGEINSESKVSTGILGLDSLLFGGVPLRNQILVAGSPGTGKTLMTFEILYRNAKARIPGVYISFDEHKKSLLENVKSAFSNFEDVDELIEKNMLVISEQRILTAYGSKENFEAFVAGLNKVVKQNSAEVVVLDSLSPMRPLFVNDREFTRAVNFLVENFRSLGVTTFITLETESRNINNWSITDLLGTYMFDGLIRLNTVGREGSFQFLIGIVKMRRSNHSNVSMPYEITSKGINVFK